MADRSATSSTDGVTIFLTTQYLEEADRLADRVAVLDHGRIVAHGTPAELKRLVPGGHVRLEFGDAAELERAAGVFTRGARDEESLALLIPSDGGIGSLRALLDELDAASIDVDALSIRTPDLDDVFLSLTDSADARKGAPDDRLDLVFADSATMIRRNLVHMRRYPSLSLFMAGIPVLFLLLFVYVFGGTLGDGIGGALGGRDAYIAYVVPGHPAMGVAGAATNTAISVAMDMTEGIVARFRTMSISRSSVLIGHVVGSIVQTAIALAIVVGVALLIGFRPTTGPVEWLAALGMLALAALAVTWLGVALGLAAGRLRPRATRRCS